MHRTIKGKCNPLSCVVKLYFGPITNLSAVEIEKYQSLLAKVGWRKFRGVGKVFNSKEDYVKYLHELDGKQIPEEEKLPVVVLPKTSGYKAIGDISLVKATQKTIRRKNTPPKKDLHEMEEVPVIIRPKNTIRLPSKRGTRTLFN